MDSVFDEVHLEFDRHGSLPTTHESQGSDMDLFGGLLGWGAADARLPHSPQTLRDAGMHFAEIQNLLNVLNRLADMGSTILVIEHNLDVIKCADWLIDLGPDGGDAGGRVIADGTPEQLTRMDHSYTGQYLKQELKMR